MLFALLDVHVFLYFHNITEAVIKSALNET